MQRNLLNERKEHCTIWILKMKTKAKVCIIIPDSVCVKVKDIFD